MSRQCARVPGRQLVGVGVSGRATRGCNRMWRAHVEAVSVSLLRTFSMLSSCRQKEIRLPERLLQLLRGRRKSLMNSALASISTLLRSGCRCTGNADAANRAVGEAAFHRMADRASLAAVCAMLRAMSRTPLGPIWEAGHELTATGREEAAHLVAEQAGATDITG